MIIGSIICTIITIFLCLMGLNQEYKTTYKTGEMTHEVDWGDIASGYQGNVGDKITIDKHDTLQYFLGEDPLFIILTILFILLVVGLLVSVYLRNECILDPESKLPLILRICVLLMPVIITIFESLMYAGLVFSITKGLGVITIATAIGVLIFSLVKDENIEWS